MRYGNDLILPTHSRLVFKRNQAAFSILKEVFAMNETDYNARLYEKMKAEGAVKIYAQNYLQAPAE